MPTGYKNKVFIYYKVRDEFKLKNLEYAVLDYITRIGRNRYKKNHPQFYHDCLPISKATYYRLIDKLEEKNLLIPSEEKPKRYRASRSFKRMLSEERKKPPKEAAYVEVFNDSFNLFKSFNQLVFACMLYSTNQKNAIRSYGIWMSVSDKHINGMKKELKKIAKESGYKSFNNWLESITY